MGDCMKLFSALVIVTNLVYSYALAKTNQVHLPSAQVICVIIIDQLAMYHLQDLTFKQGFKLFLDKGFSFENAHFNTAVPGTACDHTTISTGAYASTHGITANTWFNQQNKLIPVEQDNRFPLLDHKPGQKITGASPHNIMADTLSDQVMFANSPRTPYQSVAVSVKARAAISCGGRNAAVFWFNENTGNITSSTAYFKELPSWVTKFNQEYNPFDHYASITWTPFYQDPQMYHRYTIAKNDYQPAPSLFNTTIMLKKDGTIIDKHLELFERTPAMDEVLFPFAKLCFEQYKPTKDGHLLFWFSVSSLDKIGHVHGPWSKEAIDYLYHLDKHLLDFMEYVQKSVGKENVLFVLTADHGTIQIPEQINHSPVPLGHRVYTKTLIDQMNAFIEQKYGIGEGIIGYQAPGFYINKQIQDSQKEEIANDIKNMLRALPQIKQVWTADELTKTCSKEAQPYKHQWYQGRSPDIICEPTPYTLITKDPVGIDHASPYNYDTQIPLIFYWPGHLPAHRIYDPVNMTQLARTLSFILDVPPPSASTYQVLPELLSCLNKKQKR